MPQLTRWFIKAAMLSLIAAFLIRAAMALWPTLNAPFAPVFLHLFMWGWVTQMIFGVVYWMFSIASKIDDIE